MAGTALVTGSSRGIGLALSRELHSRGWKVIATCRNPAAIQDEPFYKKLELSIDSDESIEGLVKELGGEPLNLLINNAGIYTRGYDTIDKLTRAHLLHEFNIDAASPILLTKALLPNLEAAKGAVANISSLLGSIGDCSSAKSYGYRCSKAALNMMTKVLHLETEGKLRYVVAVHPGLVGTDMVGGPREGSITPEESAKAIIETLEKIEPAQYGHMINRHGKIEQW